MVSSIERFHCIQDSQGGANGVHYREVPLYQRCGLDTGALVRGPPELRMLNGRRVWWRGRGDTLVGVPQQVPFLDHFGTSGRGHLVQTAAQWLRLVGQTAICWSRKCGGGGNETVEEESGVEGNGCVRSVTWRWDDRLC